VLDARRPADGPVATLHLPANAGITFHGTWRPAA
jgi:carotenoid cleavage dioxygenase-like enzyme